MLKSILLSSLFVSSLSAVSQFTYKSCGDSTDIAQNVVLSVDPVLPQTDYTLFLDADMSKEVTQGNSHYTVTLNGLPVSTPTNDLCTEIQNSNITCPLYQGHLAMQSKGTIPSGVSGKIVITNDWVDTINNQRILCMQFTIRI
jgi:hypothetical protein